MQLESSESESETEKGVVWYPPAGAVAARRSAAEESALRKLLDVPALAWFAHVPSTMDVAHALAEGTAAAGTLVLADAQSRGRGRSGKTWVSPPGGGIWITLIERPLDATAVRVLSLRIGVRVAQVLDRFAGAPVQLKWPNDLMLPSGKVGGILLEARWREQRIDWVAIGLGVNVGAGGPPGSASLGDWRDREMVLAELVPALRSAAAARGGLTPGELAEYARRDWALGRRTVLPCAGTVSGISPDGGVLIATSTGKVECASGSLVFEGELP